MKKKNVIFIFTDDQRFDTISALGNDEIDTPNLDRLVSEGVTFTHAHIMGACAGAVCMPSRAMLMTGRNLFGLWDEGQFIPEEHITFPQHFHMNGYESAHIGKWHQDHDSHKRSFTKGGKLFNMTNGGWYEACNGHWNIPVHDFEPVEPYVKEKEYHEPPMEPFTKPFEKTKDRGKHSAEVFTDEALKIIRDHKETSNKPLMMYLAHIAPHDPRQYPARLLEKYPKERITLPENFAIQHPFDNGDLYLRDELLEAHPRQPENIRQHIADYYAIINHVDEQVGLILDLLDELDMRKDTILVFAGDNGLAVGQHGLMGKQSLYDHSVRVPLIITGPGIPKNVRSDAYCYLFDLYPTLCELNGLDIPETVQGKSLVPILEDPKAKVRKELFTAYKEFQRAYRDERYKLIEYVVGDRRNTQLFDLQEDPKELHNLAEDPAHSDRVAAMRENLKRWKTELNDNHGNFGRVFWRGFNNSPGVRE